MKNIGIMLCNKISYKCTGTGCTNAFNKRIDAFNIYEKNNVQLSAIFHCNGCGSMDTDDFNYKLKQMKRWEIKTIHFAKCIEVECYRYEAMYDYLENKGFHIIKGSHK